MSMRTDCSAVQLAASRLRGRPRRLVEYLASRPSALTGEIARDCACHNVSDAVAKANRELEKVGCYISGELPSPPIKNRYGEMSMQYRWCIGLL